MKTYWHNLLLSDQWSYKLSRHVLFWTARAVFMISFDSWHKWGHWNETEAIFNLTIIFVKFLLEVLYCYAGIYWLLPKYLMKENYVAFGAGFLFISLLDNALLHLFLYWFLPSALYPGFFVIAQSIFGNFITWLSFPICILLIAYKMLKNWYLKEEEKNALTLGNTNAELLLLKAQVHPHFLFNTLNNIYSFTLYKSPLAGELVAKLSHIIRYMTKECDRDLVPLSKEIKILNDYIGLEKIRYGNRLDLQVEINGDAENKLIAPLLMIPFIENSFKHGASRMLEHPWIKLNINIEEEKLHFQLSNSKPAAALNPNGKGGLGLNNVKRRLELLYPTSHQLTIKSEEIVFSVEMVVVLEKSQEPVKFHQSEFTTSMAI